ncbi:MAG: hypothetical protein DBX66_01885 [Clostridiales bacterium]|nr:MAG: hypothetical protein DBX66_01885 [Clostridiales bacterium]RGB64605.1 ComF family protein [Harryflintia acetispora]
MDILKRIGAIFYPPRCIFCSRVVHYNETCCPDCRARLPQGSEPFFPEENSCLSGCCAPFFYKGVVRERLISFKSVRHRELGHAFALLAAPGVKAALGETRPLVCCVPNFEPEQRRVYNPARVFGRALAKELGLPFEGALLIQTRKKQAQHMLSARERLHNVEDLFAVALPELSEGRDILLCDDIITTGATLNACAKALLEAGARQVFGAGCARSGHFANLRGDEKSG